MRDGWILESRIDQEIGAEVTPFLVDLLMLSILCSSRLYGFLHSVDIMQESRFSGGKDICHEIFR